MASPYSKDLRVRVIRAVEGGASRRKAAQTFDVSVSFAIKLLRRWRETGEAAAKPMGGTKKYALAEHEALVRELVARTPDMTLEELRQGLARAGITVGRTSVWRFLEAIGLTLKKRHSTPPSRRGPTWRQAAPLGARASQR
jgi:putative transposase